MSMWTRRAPKLKTLLPMTNGIFNHMNYQFKADIDKDAMDMMLKTDYGERNPSPVVDYVVGFAEAENPREFVWTQMTEAQLTTLAELILSMYKRKWDKLGDVYDIEYDPIHNYLDEWEDESDGIKNNTQTHNLTRRDSYDLHVDRENTRTDDLEDSTTGTVQKSNTRTDNLSETVEIDETHTDSGTGADNVFGFNSVAAVGSDTNSSSNSGGYNTDSTKANTGTRTDAGVDTYNTTLAHTGTRADDGSEDTTGTMTRGTTGTVTDAGTDSRDRSGRHFGNIGNLTSQKQILEEIELWKWNYAREILEDVRDFIALPTYL